MAIRDTCPAGLRDDLATTRVEEDGIVYYDVIDPASGREFRFYEHEYLLGRQLRPGRPLGDLAAWVKWELGIETTPEDLQVFVEHVGGLGFLAGVAAVPAPPAAGQAADAAVAQFAAVAAAQAELADATAIPFAGPAAAAPPGRAL
ncbi:MAG TPA: hypothetical protein VGQ83_30070, partial [Polyangia bacterium]